MSTPIVIRAHRHCTRHRNEVTASKACGCFYCLAIFQPDEIEKWTDDGQGVGQTGLCPKCGIDAVIGSESGYPITDEFLLAMQAHWF